MKYLRKLTDVDTWLYISLWLFIGGTIYLMIALFHDSNQLTIKEIIEQKPITTTVTVTSQTIESHLDLRIGQEDPTDIEGIEQKAITGNINVTYVTSGGENITETYSVQQIHDKQMPTTGSTINKTYYTGTYKLNSGKTITINSAKLLKRGDSSIVNDKFHYSWTQVNPQIEPMETTIRVHYKRKVGIYTKHYAKTLPYTLIP